MSDDDDFVQESRRDVKREREDNTVQMGKKTRISDSATSSTSRNSPQPQMMRNIPVRVSPVTARAITTTTTTTTTTTHPSIQTKNLDNPVPATFTTEMVKWLLNEAADAKATSESGMARIGDEEKATVPISPEATKAVMELLKHLVKEAVTRAQDEAIFDGEELSAKHVAKIVPKLLQDFS